jgi:hypothetical protein
VGRENRRTGVESFEKSGERAVHRGFGKQNPQAEKPQMDKTKGKGLRFRADVPHLR